MLKVTGQDLIFLDGITELNLDNKIKRIEKNKEHIILFENEQKNWYKLYQCAFHLTPETIATFEEDEQEHFSSSQEAECKFLLQVNEAGEFIPAKDAPLYLFYRLDVKTGFPFFIHSYFSVTIDRKHLSDNSPLNERLLGHIAEFIAGDFLKEVMRDFPQKELAVLAYELKANANIESLYNTIPKALRDKRFIYHAQTRQHLMPFQVVLTTKKSVINLFNNGILGDKYLLYIEDMAIYSWLSRVLKIPDVKNEHILPHLEARCEENKHNPKFFELLYELIEELNIDVKNKKILLTEHSQLVAGTGSELYYQRKGGYTMPPELEQSLAFLHKSIKVDDLKDHAKRNLGLREFSEENLFRAALRVFENHSPLIQLENSSLAISILRFLKSMVIVNEISLAEITDKILLPVIHKGTCNRDWKAPLTTPVYFEDFSFAYEYGQNYFFVDLEILSQGVDLEGWRVFLGQLGVQRFPGVFINPETTVKTSSKISTVANDRLFHQPANEITPGFGASIINNWRSYRLFVINENRASKGLRVNRWKPNDNEKLKYTGLYRFLSEHKWLAATYKGETIFCQPREVIGMTQLEAGKNSNQIISQYLPVVKLDTQLNADFIADFNIIHISGDSIANYKRLLKLVNQRYNELSISDKSSFEKFFNRILTFIHDYLQSKEESVRNNQRDELKGEYFLTKSIVNGTYHWSLGSKAIHIDDSAFLEGLSASTIELIQEPYSFTKKDRNEWGKIGARIGRKLSDIIQSNVVSSGEPRPLKTEIEYLEVIIGFVEDELGQHLSDEQIEWLGEVNILIHTTLKLSVIVEGNSAELNQPIYVEGSGTSSIFHLDSRKVNRSDSSYYKFISKALSEFFVRFTGTEIKRFDVVIEHILRLPDKQSRYNYAISREIDDNRLEAIRSILHEGVGEVDINEEVSTTSAPIVAGSPVIITTSTNTVSTTNQTEVTLQVSDEEYFAILDVETNNEIVAFSGSANTFFNGITNNGNGGSQGFAAPVMTELSEKSMKMIGFFAEYYVYKRIINCNVNMLSHLNCSPMQAQSIIWFNKPKLISRDLKDQSIGKGCDMVLEQPGICIEIKGMMRDHNMISVTGPEFEKMKEKGSDYYLVIVRNLFNDNLRSTLVIRDPYTQICNGVIQIIEAKLLSP
jgi:hypothetical protein